MSAGRIMSERFASRRVFVRLFDVEPELFARAPQERQRELIQRLTVPLHRFPRARWIPPAAGEDCLGLLVTEGLILREFTILGRRSVDLVGPGDLVWSDEAIPLGATSCSARWQGLTEGSAVYLGAQAVRLLRLLPGAIPELFRRAGKRTQGPTLQAAIRKVRTSERVLLVLCYLAARWGEADDDGEVTIPFPLSHGVIADLVAAERQTVTQQLSLLKREGVVARKRNRCWVVRPRAFESLDRFGPAVSQATESPEGATAATVRAQRRALA